MLYFVNARKMPNYLSKNVFELWYQNTLDHISSLAALPLVNLPDLNIRFSNEEKAAKYGSISVEHFKNMVRNKYRTDENVERILANIRCCEDLSGNETIPILAEAICECDPSHFFEDVLVWLEERHADIEFRAKTLGSYNHEKKEIVLYTVNIENPHSIRESMQSFETVFAHELFHAYHYQNNDMELVCRHDYTSKVVKESLASAFEWSYCAENKLSGEYDLKRSWEEHSVFQYPYSGAVRLIDRSKRCLDETMFGEVFALSLHDMDAALRNLLDKTDFYMIKNKRYISEKHKKEMFYNSFGDMTVQEIARVHIPRIVADKPHLAKCLADKSYCKEKLNFDSYSILSPVMIAGRYYKSIIVTAGSDVYYLCNHWRKNRTYLLDWIWETDESDF